MLHGRSVVRYEEPGDQARTRSGKPSPFDDLENRTEEEKKFNITPLHSYYGRGRTTGFIRLLFLFIPRSIAVRPGPVLPPLNMFSCSPSRNQRTGTALEPRIPQSSTRSQVYAARPARDMAYPTFPFLDGIAAAISRKQTNKQTRGQHFYGPPEERELQRKHGAKTFRLTNSLLYQKILSNDPVFQSHYANMPRPLLFPSPPQTYSGSPASSPSSTIRFFTLSP